MRVRYILNTQDNLPQAELADQLTRHIKPGHKKAFVFDRITVLVRRLRDVKQIFTFGGADAFFVVPSRKSDLSLGIATKALHPAPEPLSTAAVGIITNLLPRLLPAKKSGAHVSANDFRSVRKGKTTITPVRPGKYDSLSHPGDVSWVSYDKKTVLSWWGGAKYCTSAAFLAGLSAAPQVTTAMLDADATSQLSDVIDGTVPCAATTDSGTPAVNNYAWGRAIPANLEYNVWRNGRLWKKNAPGLAHGVYNKGLDLCSLWGEVVSAGDCWMIRPHIRVHHDADPTDPLDQSYTYTLPIRMKLNNAILGTAVTAYSFKENLFLLSRTTTVYPFFGKFDPLLRQVVIYGVFNLYGSTVDTNGVFTCVIPEVAVDAGNAEIIGNQSITGSTRTVAVTTGNTSLPADAASPDSVSWGGVFMNDDLSFWDYYSGDTRNLVAYSIIGTGEALTRTLLTDSTTQTTVTRIDDELLPYAEADYSSGRAVSTSSSSKITSIRNYREVGVKVKSIIKPNTGLRGYDERFQILSGGSTGGVQPSSLGYVTRIQKEVAYIKEDLSAQEGPTYVTSFDMPVWEFYGVYSQADRANACMALAGYDGDVAVRNAPSLPGGAAGVWSWVDLIVWTKFLTVDGERLCEVAKRQITSAYQLTTSTWNNGTFGASISWIDNSYTGAVAYGLYLNYFDELRFKYETRANSTVSSTALTFGSMPSVSMLNYYTGSRVSVSWTNASGGNIDSRSYNSTSIDVLPVPVIFAYGDLRWPVAQQLTVAPWQCTDSHGRVFHPGKVRMTSSSDLGGTTSTIDFEEIVFDPTDPTLLPFSESLTATPSSYTIQDTYIQRVNEFSSHDDYVAGFYDAAQLAKGVDQYSGVPMLSSPTSNQLSFLYSSLLYLWFNETLPPVSSTLDVSGPLQAPSLDGLEYFWHYDIDPDRTVMFGIPYGKMQDANTRPRTWTRPISPTGPNTPIRQAIDGLFDDQVVYNSPIFTAKL